MTEEEEEESEITSTIWKPDFDEFILGITPQDINSHLPRPFLTVQWDSLPQADEYKHDVVRYFWLRLDRFGDEIIKFIPSNITIHNFSYICFLFIDQKLFHISIRLFYDQRYTNYDEIIEAYANSLNCPLIETEYGNHLYHEDDKIIYFSYQCPDQSHTLIQIIKKDSIVPIDGFGIDHLEKYRQQREEHIKSFILTN